MGRRRPGRIFTALAFLTICLSAGAGGDVSALAGGKIHDLSELEILEFEVETGKNEALSVASSSFDQVTVTVSRAAGRNALVSSGYSVPAHFTTAGIHANLGKLGSVSMAFHPSGARRGSRSRAADCSDDSGRATTGVFSGSLRFRTEDGSVDVRRQRARGKLFTAASVICPKKKPEERGGAALSVTDCRGTSVLASAPDPGVATDRREGEPGLLMAMRTEDRGRVRITRQAMLFGRAARFDFSPDLSTATLEPPSPFSGAAAVAKDPVSGETSWSGDLRIAFPGKEVALTGPEMKATLKKSEGAGGILGAFIGAVLGEESTCEKEQEAPAK